MTFSTAHSHGGDGTVNEDVFAFSNLMGDERALVVYHNKYTETRGWIKTSAAAMDKSAGELVQKTLAEAISLPNEQYAIFKDYVTGMEYIRSCRELSEKGLYVELGGYQCHVFLDWRFVTGQQWDTVKRDLAGAGTISIQDKFAELSAPKEGVKLEQLHRKPRAARSAKGSEAKKDATKRPAKRKAVGSSKTGKSRKKD